MENVQSVETQSLPEKESPTIPTSEKSIAQLTVVPSRSQAKKTPKKRKKVSRKPNVSIVWITGSKKWKKANVIRKNLSRVAFKEVDYVVLGTRSGAEAIAQRVARSMGFNLILVPSNTKRYGDSAEAIRDENIVKHFQPTYVLAFYENPGEDGGRYDNLPRACRLAKKKEIEFQLIKK